METRSVVVVGALGVMGAAGGGCDGLGGRCGMHAPCALVGSFTVEDADAGWSGGQGVALCPLGDVDGDGSAEFLVDLDFFSTCPLYGAGYDRVLAWRGGAGISGEYSSLDAPFVLVGLTSAPDKDGIDEVDGLEGTCGAGDIDGDGYPDVVVGDPGRDRESRTDAGAVFVLLGGPDSVEPRSVDAAEVTLFGVEEGDLAGDAVAGVGDWNGDGFGDVAVLSGGAVHLWPGSAGVAGEFELAGDTVLVERRGSGYDSVAGLGDVDGDGLSDLAVGSADCGEADGDPGRAFVFLGRSSSQGSLSVEEADAVLVGESDADCLTAGVRRAVAGVGDVNGDGFDDVIVGAPGNDEAGDAAGAAYVVFGGSAWAGERSLATADWILRGASAGAEAGYAVAGAGDVDGDGYRDLLVGAPAQGGVGAVHLVYGGDGVGGEFGLASADATIEGVGGSSLGWTVAGAGDVDGDGYGDVTIGGLASLGHGLTHLFRGGPR